MIVRASEDLKKLVEDELKVADPSVEEVRKILKAYGVCNSGTHRDDSKRDK